MAQSSDFKKNLKIQTKGKKFKILFFLLFLLAGYKSVFQILPSEDTPILHSISNASEKSSLTLNFQFSFSISKSTTVVISLPSGFAMDPLLVSCDPACTLNVPSLRVFVNYPNGVERLTTYTVSIFNVTNPNTQGSTSPFALVANSINSATGQEFIFAENLNFASLGISKNVEDLIAVSFKMLDHHEKDFRNYYHSEIAKTSEDLVFSLGFRVPLDMSKDILLQMVFPLGSFEADNLICLQESINFTRNFSNIKCSFNSDNRFLYITIEGFESDIEASEAMRFLISLKNPSYKTDVTNFDIFIFKRGTNTALAKSLKVTLPEVLPNNLTKLNIEQTNQEIVLSGKKVVWTLLQFQTISTLPAKSQIIIVLPLNLDLHVRSTSLADLQNSLLIFSGIEKISNDIQISLKKDTFFGRNRLIISNFKEHQYPQLIQLKLLLSIGNITDFSDFFFIETGFYNSSSTYTLMERNNSTLRLKVVSVEVPSIHSLSLSNELADGSTITDVSFVFTSEITIPTNDSIVLILDDNINLHLVEPHNCLAKLTSSQNASDFTRDQQTIINSVVYIKSNYCVGQNGKITMHLPFAYNTGEDIDILLKQVIISPTLSAEYLFDISICRAVESLVEDVQSFEFRQFIIQNMLVHRQNLDNYFNSSTESCQSLVSYTELPFLKPQNLTNLKVNFIPAVESKEGFLVFQFNAPTNITSSPPYYQDAGSQETR